MAAVIALGAVCDPHIAQWRSFGGHAPLICWVPEINRWSAPPRPLPIRFCWWARQPKPRDQPHALATCPPAISHKKPARLAEGSFLIDCILGRAERLLSRVPMVNRSSYIEYSTHLDFADSLVQIELED
jgi:hypothetical protein